MPCVQLFSLNVLSAMSEIFDGAMCPLYQRASCVYTKSYTPEKQVGTGEMENSGRFPKGVSGNPKGRPKSGEALTELFRQYLDAIDPELRVPRKQKLVEELYRRAMGSSKKGKNGKTIMIPGSDELLKYIINRLDGMPRQALELDAFVEGEDALTVIIEAQEPLTTMQEQENK